MLQVFIWLDTELVDHELACGAIHLQCLSLPPVVVERAHQLTAQPFPVGMRGDERGQLADQPRVSAEAQTGLQPVFHSLHPLPFEAVSLCGYRGGSLYVEQGGSPP